LALGWNYFSKLRFKEGTVLLACVALLGIVKVTLVNVFVAGLAAIENDRTQDAKG
jgi:hypothetical protein